MSTMDLHAPKYSKKPELFDNFDNFKVVDAIELDKPINVIVNEHTDKETEDLASWQ